MHGRTELKERATRVIHKKAALGSDINLDEFDEAPVSHSYLEHNELRELPMADQKRLIMSGLDVTKKNRGGTFLQKDTEVIHCHSQQDGIEVIPIKKALEETLEDLSGLLKALCSGQAKGHHKTILERAPLPLNTALCLWSPRLDQGDSQFLHGPCELGQGNDIFELLDDRRFSGCVKDGVAVCIQA